MQPYWSTLLGSLYQGCCMDVLRSLPAGLVNCCVTSPPYFGLRDYGHTAHRWPAVEYVPLPGLPGVIVPEMECCLGLEPSPEAFIGHIVLVFREVHRVLRDDGTLWLNLGDSYARTGGTDRAVSSTAQCGNTKRSMEQIADRTSAAPAGLKPKDLIGIPWRVAFALQADGWYLRQDIIWHKPNPMPESVTDRCTKAHEYIFLLSKSERYFYDHEAVKEDAVCDRKRGPALHPDTVSTNGNSGLSLREPQETRNRRSVWTVATKPYSGAHFATFPPDLIRPCILAGCPEYGIVLDPFGGSGTTAQVAEEHNRCWITSELSVPYCDLHVQRVGGAPC